MYSMLVIKTCWKSKEQDAVDLITCEAEYEATSAELKQSLWTPRLLQELADKQAPHTLTTAISPT